MKNVHIPFHEKAILLSEVTGTFIKLTYAFCYQEEFVKILDLEDAWTKWWGGTLIPVVNVVADYFTGFK